MGRQGWGPHSKQSRWRIMLPELWSFNFYMWAHRLSTEPTIKHFPLKYQAWHFMISYNVFCPQYSNEVKELGDVEILLLLCLFCYCEILFPKTRWTLTKLTKNNCFIISRHYGNSCPFIGVKVIMKISAKKWSDCWTYTGYSQSHISGHIYQPGRKQTT